MEHHQRSDGDGGAQPDAPDQETPGEDNDSVGSDVPGTPRQVQAHVVWGLPGHSSSTSTSRSTSGSSPQLRSISGTTHLVFPDRTGHVPTPHEVVVIDSSSNGSSDDVPSAGSQQIPFPNLGKTASPAQMSEGQIPDAAGPFSTPCPGVAEVEGELAASLHSLPKGTGGPTASSSVARATIASASASSGAAAKPSAAASSSSSFSAAAAAKSSASASASSSAEAKPSVSAALPAASVAASLREQRFSRASPSTIQEGVPYLDHSFLEDPPVPRWVLANADPSKRPPAAAPAATAATAVQQQPPSPKAAAEDPPPISRSLRRDVSSSEVSGSGNDDDECQDGALPVSNTSVRYRMAQYADQVRQLPEGIPSVGSALHDTETCRPCFFMFTRLGCMYGAACEYCHREHSRPKRERASKQQRRFCRTLVQTWIQQQSELGIHDEDEVTTSFTQHLEERQLDRLLVKCARQMMRSAFR